MHNKLLVGVCCIVIPFLVIYNVLAVSETKTPATKLLSATTNFSKAGYVSLEYIVKFEDVKPLTPDMARATALLRKGQCQEALAAFQSIQRTAPAEALAYRGENEASRFLNTLDTTIAHDQQLLSAAKTDTRTTTNASLAAINYGLGDAMSMKNYPTPLGETPHALGWEPKQHFLEAIRLEPNLIEARLALAAYYEHGSQRQGTAARRQYDICLRRRPDLYQIRYLHAASWDRPGYLLNNTELRSRGIQISDDEQSMPQRTIAENLALIYDHPQYAPPYYSLGSDYADPRYPWHDDVKARYYLAVYAKIGDPTTEWWQYATSEIETIDREHVANPQ